MARQSLSAAWSRETRYVKRELSSAEKATVPTTRGRALVLPGAPGSEIEELIEAGFDAAYIIGVEHQARLADELMEYYRDGAHVFCAEVCDFMRHARMAQTYSYIHLDFCCQLTRELAVDIQAWRPLVAPTARVRMSTFRGRRSPAQMDTETLLINDTLLTWCEAAHDLDNSDRPRWVAFHDFLVDHDTDTATVMAAIMIANFFFGMDDFEEYVAEARARGPFIPEVRGTHAISDITRWNYHERSSPNHMATTWVDLEPLGLDALRHSTQWTLNGLARIMSRLTDHGTPDYTYMPE